MARQKKTETQQDPTDLGVMDMSVNAVAIQSSQRISDDEVLGFWHVAGKEVPGYATESSAAFDFRAYLVEGSELKYYNYSNAVGTKKVKEGGRVFVEPGERILIPTGLHADIPEGYWLAIHPRSGTSWKTGLGLSNSVAVIDSDYVEEIFISVINMSGVRIVIENDERIAQGVLQLKWTIPVKVLSEKPTQKTSRAGGFGSTGTK